MRRPCVVSIAGSRARVTRAPLTMSDARGDKEASSVKVTSLPSSEESGPNHQHVDSPHRPTVTSEMDSSVACV